MPADLTSSQRRVLPLIFVTTVTSILGNSLLAPVLPNILETFDRPDGSAGYLVAVSSLPGIFVAPIIGLMADRLGRRAVLTPCLFVFGAAGLCAAAAPTFETMLLARFVMGFGSAGLVNLAIVLISDNFSGEDRTHWIGINAGALTAALALFPLLSGLLTEVAGWRWALSLYGLGLLSALGAWFVLDERRPGNPPTMRAQLGGAGEALRQPLILTSIAAGGLSFAVIFGVFLTTLPGHLEDDFGLSAGVRGIVIGAPAVTSSLAAFNLGRIRRSIPAGLLLVLASLGWVVAFTVIGLASVLPLLIVATLLYGVGEGVMIPTMQDSALAQAPDDHRAIVMAAWTASARLGQTAGPLLAAVLLSGWGTTTALLGGTVGSLLLLALYFLGPGRPTGRESVRLVRR